jgi:hypothetical protein
MGTTDENIIQRIRYTQNEGKRRRKLKDLHSLIKILERLTRTDTSYAVIVESAPADQRLPDSKSRQLVHKAYDAMSKIWSCDCPSPHKAKLCVKRRYDCFDDPSISSLDIYISGDSGTLGNRWHKGSLVLDPDS